MIYVVKVVDVVVVVIYVVKVVDVVVIVIYVVKVVDVVVVLAANDVFRNPLRDLQVANDDT